MNYIARLARRTITHLLPRSAREVRCSGCGQLHDASRRTISGPGVYLCQDCFRNLTETLAPKRPPANATRCHFCRQFKAPAEVARAGSVAVCAECLGAMEMIFEDTQA